MGNTNSPGGLGIQSGAPAPSAGQGAGNGSPDGWDGASACASDVAAAAPTSVTARAAALALVSLPGLCLSASSLASVACRHGTLGVASASYGRALYHVGANRNGDASATARRTDYIA